MDIQEEVEGEDSESIRGHIQRNKPDPAPWEMIEINKH